jgi:hypothetical protein
MTKRQLLLRLRDSTENELRELGSLENFTHADNDWSSSDALTFANRLKDTSGVVTPLDLALAKRGLEKLCH